MLVLVTVGTDHHAFDRVVRWADEWAATCAEACEVLVQFGTAPAPTTAAGVDYLSHRELQTALQRATVVVCHGGPATIGEAWRAGHLPLVVPRQRRLGEHVDDHQLAFASKLEQSGSLVYLRSETEFRAAMERVLADPQAFRLQRRPSPPSEEAVGALSRLIQTMLLETRDMKASESAARRRRILSGWRAARRVPAPRRPLQLSVWRSRP
jgi:UDP-N-acetylglucosamine transferase subunit ALG13